MLDVQSTLTSLLEGGKDPVRCFCLGVALESEASQVVSLKEFCPVEIAQKYYYLCLNAGLMLGSTVIVW